MYLCCTLGEFVPNRRTRSCSTRVILPKGTPYGVVQMIWGDIVVSLMPNLALSTSNRLISGQRSSDRLAHRLRFFPRRDPGLYENSLGITILVSRMNISNRDKFGMYFLQYRYLRQLVVSGPVHVGWPKFHICFTFLDIMLRFVDNCAKSFRNYDNNIPFQLNVAAECLLTSGMQSVTSETLRKSTEEVKHPNYTLSYIKLTKKIKISPFGSSFSFHPPVPSPL